ncbi:ECF RNA polymerase sigma factor SigJ [Alphaproteobacteria bacterium SO-S41]|nr:ECF RNA polymerase sigma factor SigJ [Alphaproteobacteria bacterium SO-S41]
MSGAASFEAERPRLTRLAYRMLGERGAAEDVVQETWLRWAKIDQSEIASPPAWLTRTASRLAIDALRRAKARREDYIGPWLPEPVVETPDEEDSEDERAERISLGFLHVLERLSPDERAAFILHDAFDCGYDEIAAALNKTEPACRKLVSRARERVRSGRPRFETDRAQQQRVITAFMAAAAKGDAAAMKALLTEDAIVYSDGGGKVRAALRPLIGPDDAVHVLLSVARKFAAQMLEVMVVDINGQFGLAMSHEGRLHSLYTADIENGRIAKLYIVRNPDKLARAAAALSGGRAAH